MAWYEMAHHRKLRKNEIQSNLGFMRQVEVQDITRHGVWLFLKGREFFLPFKDFPWFKDAKVSAVYNVTLQHSSHLYWPDLDVDLYVDSVESSEKFPLLAKR